MKSTGKKVGDIVHCINAEPLSDTKVAPPLMVDRDYTIKEIILDAQGHEHFDVGLKSRYAFVRSLETGDELDRGDKIHWCHPSRFALLFIFAAILFSCAEHYCPSYSSFKYNHKIVMAKNYKR